MIAFVRSLGYHSVSAFSTTAPLTGVTLNAGDVVVLCLRWSQFTNGFTVSGVADGLGNTWASVPGTHAYNSVLGFSQELWYSVITTGGSGITITATWTGSVGYPNISGEEWSGVDTSSPIDQSSQQATNAVPTSPAITTTTANEVIAAYFFQNNTSPTAGTGW